MCRGLSLQDVTPSAGIDAPYQLPAGRAPPDHSRDTEDRKAHTTAPPKACEPYRRERVELTPGTVNEP
jgi:hypothetical protein